MKTQSVGKHLIIAAGILVFVIGWLGFLGYVGWQLLTKLLSGEG